MCFCLYMELATACFYHLEFVFSSGLLYIQAVMIISQKECELLQMKAVIC